MRHRVRGRHLSRTSSHRLALRRNMAANLLTHGRIVTTMPKAKEVRPFVEKLITLARKAVSKKDTDRPAYVHYYRMVLSRLQNKELTQKLVGEGKWREEGGIAQKYLTRNGGYTRILRLSGSRLGVLTGGKVGKIPELEYNMGGVDRKLRMVGNRLGDNADRVLFELVEEKAAETEVSPKPEAPKKVESKQPKTSPKPKQTKAQAAKTKETEVPSTETKEAKAQSTKAEETKRPSGRPSGAGKKAEKEKKQKEEEQ